MYLNVFRAPCKTNDDHSIVHQILSDHGSDTRTGPSNKSDTTFPTLHFDQQCKRRTWSLIKYTQHSEGRRCVYMRLYTWHRVTAVTKSHICEWRSSDQAHCAHSCQRIMTHDYRVYLVLHTHFTHVSFL